VLEPQTPPPPDPRSDRGDAIQQPPLPPRWAPPGPLLVLREHLKVVQSGFGSVDDWRHTLGSFCCRVLAIGLRRAPLDVFQPIVDVEPERPVHVWEPSPEIGSPLRPRVGAVFEPPRLRRMRGQL
jgi:hypothetical protein